MQAQMLLFIFVWITSALLFLGKTVCRMLWAIHFFMQDYCCKADKDTWQGGPVAGGWHRLRWGTAHHSLIRTWMNKEKTTNSIHFFTDLKRATQSETQSHPRALKETPDLNQYNVHFYLFSVKKDVKCWRSSSAHVCMFSPLQGKHAQNLYLHV